MNQESFLILVMSMTKQRKLIKEIIYNSDRHLTAEEIFVEARKSMPSIALGTVYRNLGKLCEDKEIRLISLRGFSDCYDKSFMPHGHLICNSCGKVDDFPIDDIGEELSLRLGVSLIYYDVNAHYICDDCKRKNLVTDDSL